MSERYSVRVTKDTLVFSAGHFITFNGGECERLHGHNYRVAVELDGPLDDNYYVFDFIALKNHTQDIIAELDHRMLVALKNPSLATSVQADEVTIRFQEKRWVFPKCDCALLSIANTTVEMLAKYIGDELLKRISPFKPLALRVEVEENFGQWARVSIE